MYRYGKLSFIAVLLFALIFTTSCKVMVPSGVLPDTWYISDELNIALKFDSPRRGQYIPLNRALSAPQSFRISHSRNTVNFRFRRLPNLRGQVMVYHDRFYVVSGNRRTEFRQYYTRRMDGEPFRYVSEIFNEVSTTEVVYGRAPGFYSSKAIEKRDNKSYWQVLFEVGEGITTNIFRNQLPLELDIYQPLNDNAPLRPLVVLLHGGAFIAGDKRDELVSKLAESYTRRGFVVASVNYRLGYLFLPGRYTNLERAMYSAIQDVRAALRYLSHHSTTYRIDPDMVFLGGNSAGGILSLKTAFMDETEVWPSARGSIRRLQSDLGCLDCSTNDLHGPFTIQGVINMWGAIDNTSMMKPHNRIPVLSIHGDNDQVVPYGYDFPFTNVSSRVSSFFSRRIHGSASIDIHARSIGLDHTLYTFEGEGHEPHFNNDHNLVEENYLIIENQILSFINRILIPPFGTIQGPVSVSGTDPVAQYILHQDLYENVIFGCKNCFITGEFPSGARIVWIDGFDDHELYIQAKGPHNQVFTDTLRISTRR